MLSKDTCMYIAVDLSKSTDPLNRYLRNVLVKNELQLMSVIFSLNIASFMHNIN